MPNARRSLAAVTAGAAALLAACAPDRAPSAPSARIGQPVFAGDRFTGDPNELTALVQYLFVADEAEALVEARQVIGSEPSSAGACDGTARLLDRTFRNYRALLLYGQQDANGPDLTFPRPVVQSLVRRLSLNCSKLASSDGVPDAALDAGGAAGVIRAADGGTVETIPAPSGQAGVRVPAGTFDQDVVLYIVPEPARGQLPTTLAQVAPYYDIFVVPDQPRPYRRLLDVGFVVNWPDRPPSDHLVIGHDAPVGGMEVLQPICLTTPASGVGTWGGPAYLRPAAGCAGAVAASVASGFASANPLTSVARVARGVTTSVGGQASELSPFGLVSIFQLGVNPSAPNNGVTFGPSACVAGGRAIPYTMTSARDLVVSYQEVDANGAAVSPRTLLYLRGISAGGQGAGSVRVSRFATRRVRFFYGATLFRTVDANVAACTL